MRIRLAMVVKLLGFVLGGLVAAGAAAALLVWITFDPAATANALTEAMRARYDRTLRIGDAPRLTLWPWPAMALGKVSVSDARRSDVVAQVAELRAELSLLPLLRRQTEIRKLTLKGLDARIVRNSEGAWNIADLLADLGGAESDEAALKLDSLAIKDGVFRFEDQHSFRRARLSDLGIETGPLRDGLPNLLKLRGRLSEVAGTADAKLGVDARMILKNGLSAVALDNLRVTLAGDGFGLQGATLSASAARLSWKEDLQQGDVSRPNFHLSGAQGTRSVELGGEALTLAWQGDQIKGDKANLRAVARTVEREGEWSVLFPALVPREHGFASDAVQIKWRDRQGSVAAANSGECSARLVADLRDSSLAFDAIQGELNLAGFAPQTAQTPVALSGSARWRVGEGNGKDVVEVDLGLRSGQDQARLSSQLRRLQPLSGRFRLESSRLDLDRFYPAKAAGGGQAQSPSDQSLSDQSFFGSSIFDRAELSGQLRLSNLRTHGVRVASVQAPIAVAGGRVVASGFALGLYGGALNGEFASDLNSGKMSAAGAFNGVDLARLARESGLPLPILGEASGSYDVTMQPADGNLPAIAGLRGAVRWTTKGGALRGVDIGHALREFRSAIKEAKISARTPAEGESTDLAAASSRFVFDAGKLQAERIEARNAWVSLEGAGSADLLRGEMDFGVRAKVLSGVGQLTELPAELRTELRGKTIPLRLKGDVQRPDVRLESIMAVADNKQVDSKKAGRQ